MFIISVYFILLKIIMPIYVIIYPFRISLHLPITKSPWEDTAADKSGIRYNSPYL